MLRSPPQCLVVSLLLAVTGIQASGSVDVGAPYSISSVPVPVQGIPVLQVQSLLQPTHQSPIYSLSPVIVPYAAGTPLKLLFTQFPPRVEALVQRVQNYFSQYNYPHLIPLPQLPPTPVGTIPDGSDSTSACALTLTTTESPSTTTNIPATSTSTTPTTSTTAGAASATSTQHQQPPSPSVDNSAASGGVDYDSQGVGYRYEPPTRNTFNYPIQPRFRQQQRNNYFYRS